MQNMELQQINFGVIYCEVYLYTAISRFSRFSLFKKPQAPFFKNQEKLLGCVS